MRELPQLHAIHHLSIITVHMNKIFFEVLSTGELSWTTHKNKQTEYCHLSTWIQISLSVPCLFALIAKFSGLYWRQLSQKTLCQNTTWSETSLTGWVCKLIFNWSVELAQCTVFGPEARKVWGGGVVSSMALRWAGDAKEGSKCWASTGSLMNMAKTSFKIFYSLLVWEVPVFGLFPTKLKSLIMLNAVKDVGMKFSVSSDQLIQFLGSRKRTKIDSCLFTFTFLVIPG